MKNGGGKSLMEGLTKKAPAGVDKSMSLPKSPSVNSDTTRSTTAKSQNNTGGRVA